MSIEAKPQRRGGIDGFDDAVVEIKRFTDIFVHTSGN